MDEVYTVFLVHKETVNEDQHFAYKIPVDIDVRSHEFFEHMGKKRSCKFHIAESVELADMPITCLAKNIFEKIEVGENTSEELIKKLNMSEFVFRLTQKEEKEAFRTEIHSLRKTVARLEKQLAIQQEGGLPQGFTISAMEKQLAIQRAKFSQEEVVQMDEPVKKSEEEPTETSEKEAAMES